MPKKLRREFEVMTELVDSTHNYSAYREQLRVATLPVVPFLGLFAKDVLVTEEVSTVPMFITQVNIHAHT